MRMKEIYEPPWWFIPLRHVQAMRGILDLPTLTEPPAPTTAPTTAFPPTVPLSRSGTPLPHMPHPTCRDTNYFHIWRTLLHTPTPPYAPMPPTPPTSPSPLLLSSDMQELDIALLPKPTHTVP